MASVVEVSNQTDVEISNDQTDEEAKGKPQMIYRCKKCRRIVASEDQIVPHERGEGQKCFRRKKSDAENELPECSSIFVEPMKWMQAVEEGYLAQKLQCTGCNARLGSFSWVGMLCNCGKRIIPAFQLHKSRIDECQI